MKKTLIALAVLGATAGVAHAQSNVTIYGIADTGFIKTTGEKWFMDEKVNNRLGFRGSEDLGGGLKATFELEKRFKLFNGGVDEDGVEFEGASNVGVAGNWGAVRFGKMNEISTEYFRTLDPFNQYGVGGMFENPFRSARISSSTRYDSPNFGGFTFGVTATLKNQQTERTNPFLDPDLFDPISVNGTEDVSNDGYGLGVKYANGPFVVLANVTRPVNSNDSSVWNVGGSWAIGNLKISAGYEKAKVELSYIANDSMDDYRVGNGDWQSAMVGVSYKIGAGTINASYNQNKIDSLTGVFGSGAVGTTLSDVKDKKLSLGYTHDLSKRTAVYVDASIVQWDDARDTDDTKAVQIGMTHKF